MLLPTAPNDELLYIVLHALFNNNTPLLYPSAPFNLNPPFAVVSDIKVSLLLSTNNILHFKFMFVDICEFSEVPE